LATLFLHEYRKKTELPKSEQNFETEECRSRLTPYQSRLDIIKRVHKSPHHKRILNHHATFIYQNVRAFFQEKTVSGQHNDPSLWPAPNFLYHDSRRRQMAASERNLRMHRQQRSTPNKQTVARVPPLSQQVGKRAQ
jgi:hypothetical protein